MQEVERFLSYSPSLILLSHSVLLNAALVSWAFNTLYLLVSAPQRVGGGGVTPYDGLYMEAPPRRGTFSRFRCMKG